MYSKAFDGDLDTDSAAWSSTSGCSLGFDVGSRAAATCTELRIFPFFGTASELIGGELQMSGNGTVYETIAVVRSAHESWNTITLNQSATSLPDGGRYIRFVGRAGT
eukprot:1044880_1